MSDATVNMEPAARVEFVRRFYDHAPRVSDWLTVTQELINRFCDSVFDSDWMHVDAERARRESPFGCTVAPGFWSLSILPHLARQAMGGDYPPGTVAAINYGFDRIRFPGPVLVDSRVRVRVQLIAVTPRASGRYLVRTENAMEVAGQDRPALVADWMFLLVFQDS